MDYSRDVDIDVKDENHFDELLDWCEQNVAVLPVSASCLPWTWSGDATHSPTTSHNNTFSFARQSDAMMFILRWL